MTFETLPSASQWSTLAVAGGAGDLSTDAGLDTAMSSIAASTITSGLTTQAGSGANASGAYWRSGDQKLGTQPTGIKMTLLMATLTNTSGGSIDSLTVSYTMGMPTVTPSEEIKGHRIYWSKTGAAGSWTAEGDQILTIAGTTLAVNLNLAPLAWGNGETLYVVWADDNGSNPDGDYTIDDVSFAKTASAANLLTFGPDATITGTDIAWYVPNGSNPASLKPTYTLSPGATCDHDNGITAYDFSSPAHYFVTNLDSTVTKDYTVTVTVLPPETALIWNVAGGGTWDSSSSNWLGQTTAAVMPFFPGAIVIFNKTAGGLIPLASGMSPTSTTVSAASGTYIFTGNPIMTGPLTKSGGGTLQLNVTPANFSSTTVNGGSLYLNAVASESGFGQGPITMTDVTVNGGGLLQSHYANVTGNLTLNGGIYDENAGFSGSWSGTIYLASDSTVKSDGYGALIINASISGPGALTTWYNAGGGGDGVVLSGVNNYTGPTIVQSGHLTCRNSQALGNGGSLTINSGAYIALNYTGDHIVSALTLGGVVQLPGTYGSTGSNALFQNNTYFAATSTGTVTVSGAVRPRITSFGLPGNPASITQMTSAITWAVPTSSDVTQLAPTLTLTSGTCIPAPGTTQDFTSPVHYIVTDGALTNDYLVTVTVVPALPVLDGITLWLDASATHTMTLSSGTVNEWRDQYGSSAKATVMRGTPTWVASGIGGKPAVHFDAAGYSCMHDGLNHPAPVTIFYVGRMTGGSNQRVLSGYNNDWLLGYQYGNRDQANFGGWVSNPATAASSDPHLYVATIGGNGQASTVYGDGTLLASNQNGVQGPNDLQLNGQGIWNEFSDCDISELLVYNRVLSADELTSVSSYLTGKYFPIASSPYGTWASSHGLNGTAGSSTDPAFFADPNKDGVANGLVWLIGGTTGNPLANSSSILPVPSDNAGKLLLTFKCLKSSARGTANLYVEYSEDLGGPGDPWQGVLVPDANLPDSGSGVGFVVVPIEGSNYNNVTATIAAPVSGSKLFGRLMATEN